MATKRLSFRQHSANKESKPAPSWRQREVLASYIFLLPSLLPFLLFVAGPLVIALGLSFYRYDMLTAPEFVGWANYGRFFTDSRIITVYANTAVFVVGTMIMETGIALLLAVATNRAMPSVLRYALRTAYFFPVLTSMAAVSIVWGYLYNTNFGIINYYIRELGGPSIPWLSSSDWAMPALIFMSAWKGLGFSYIIFVAGLQSIPRHLYEAAAIDGAGRISTFFNVTLPMLSPTLFFVIVISLIGGIQVFDAPYILTSGGPGDETRTVAMYIQEEGFRFFHMGYAATISVSLFVAILTLTLIQFRLSRTWVFYQ